MTGFIFYILGHIFYEVILFPEKAFTWAIVIFKIFNLLHKSKPLFPDSLAVFSELPLIILYIRY